MKWQKASQTCPPDKEDVIIRVSDKFYIARFSPKDNLFIVTRENIKIERKEVEFWAPLEKFEK